MKVFLYFLILQFSAALHADDVIMAFGEAIPPFSFPKLDVGIEIEVIGEALAYKNHILIPKYYPLARVPFTFKHKQVEAAMTDLGQDMKAMGAFYGNPAVVYDNVLISLKKRNIKIEKPSDLKGLSVIAFQGAIKRYPAWLTPTGEDGLYTELNKQSLQVLMLNEGRQDIVLSDVSIFKYYLLQAERQTGVKMNDINIHHFIKVNPKDYRPVFWRKSIRDDFNEGLIYLKTTGRYQAIYDKYLKSDMK